MFLPNGTHFGDGMLSTRTPAEMPRILIELYCNDIDPGVRSAAGWLPQMEA